MTTAASVIHIYNGSVTTGGTDGDLVTETTVGGNRILLELNRGAESNVVPLAVRATTAACYLVQIVSDNGKILLSIDSVHWVKSIFLLTVGTNNSLFYIKSIAEQDENYGDTVWSLKVDYFAPV